MFDFLEENNALDNSFEMLLKENNCLDSSFLSIIPQKQEKVFFFEEEEKETLNSKCRSEKKQNRTDQRKQMKKDNFDYNTYIQQEMSKMDTEDMDPIVRKKMIQKIRNRMSAQRSRNRQKFKIERLVNENSFLKKENKKLKNMVRNLEEENNFLKNSITSKGDKKSISTEDDTIERNFKSVTSSFEIFREERKSSQSFKKGKGILFVVCLLFVCFLTNKEESQLVKKAGMIPFISNKIRSDRQLAFLEEKCNSYCEARDRPSSTDTSLQVFQNPKGGLQLWERDKLNLDESTPLMCFNPHLEERDRIYRMFLFDKFIMENSKNQSGLFYIPHVIQIKINDI